jgi:uroporphyrinogen decarboxylase
MKTMTSRDRVLATFQHEETDKIPRWCGASTEFWDKSKHALGLDDEKLRIRFGDDFRRVFAPYVEIGGREGVSSDRSLFGIERVGIGYGQATSHPLAKASLKELHEYPWPDPSRVDVSKLKADTKDWEGKYAILGGDWSPFWHDAIDLVGMEELYLRMYNDPQFVDTLLDYIVGYYEGSNRRILDTAADVIDILFIGNDFGSQTGPLMDVELFERFMLPHLKRLFNLGHDYGLLVQLHCCGGFEPLIPSLIEAGVDALHALQPCCTGMDPHSLKEHYGKKVVLNGGIDSQYVLIDGSSPNYVREKTLDVLKIMAPGGGYIAGASHDSILEETPLENVLAMFDAVEEFSGSSRIH